MTLWTKRSIRDGAVCLAISGLALALFARFDFFERVEEWSRTHETYELDEVILFSPILALLLAWFVVRRLQEMRQLFLEYQREKERAEEADRVKTRFLAHMSHELRTPLNAIIGCSEVMRREVFGPITNRKYKDYTRDIHLSGLMMLEMVEDLLDLSRIEAGDLVLTPETVDLATEIAFARDVTEAQADSRGVLVVIDGPPVRVVTDRRRLRQILIHLIGNGIKHNHRAGRVTVSTLALPDGGAGLRIVDTGPGMTEEQIRDALVLGGVSDRDHRIARLPAQGAGLGLPLKAALVSALGGTLEIHSAPAQGSRVIILLPDLIGSDGTGMDDQRQDNSGQGQDAGKLDIPPTSMRKVI